MPTAFHQEIFVAGGVDPSKLQVRGKGGREAKPTAPSRRRGSWKLVFEEATRKNDAIPSSFPLHQPTPWPPRQVVGEPVDVDFHSPHNPLLLLPSPGPATAASTTSERHPLYGLLRADLLAPSAGASEGGEAGGRPVVFLSVFKVRGGKGRGLSPVGVKGKEGGLS